MKIFAFSPSSAALCRQLSSALGAQGYMFARYPSPGLAPFERAGDIIKDCWGEELVFICAVGAAVRITAPFIGDKRTDSAVAVIDETARFAVAVLSGHLGGGNELARRIAAATGAEAVITTATDRRGIFAADDFARRHGLIVEDMDLAKEISAALLRGERPGFVSEKTPMPAGFDAENPELGLYIGFGDVYPFKRTLRLLVPVTVGIGCRRGTSAAEIAKAVSSAAKSAGIAPQAIARAASIDIKRDEAGLGEFCQSRDIPAVFFSAQELQAAEGDFTDSAFVKKITGVGSVCDRACALLGRLIVPKGRYGDVTVAFSAPEEWI